MWTSALKTEQVERNYIKEKKAAVKEFDDKKVELKENLIAELEEKKKMIENEKVTMELTGGKQTAAAHVCHPRVCVMERPEAMFLIEQMSSSCHSGP